MDGEKPHSYIPLDEEDPVDSMIRRTGCEAEYRAMENCIVETDRDFRACQATMKILQACMKSQRVGFNK